MHDLVKLPTDYEFIHKPACNVSNASCICLLSRYLVSRKAMRALAAFVWICICILEARSSNPQVPVAHRMFYHIHKNPFLASLSETFLYQRCPLKLHMETKPFLDHVTLFPFFFCAFLLDSLNSLEKIKHRLILNSDFYQEVLILFSLYWSDLMLI